MLAVKSIDRTGFALDALISSNAEKRIVLDQALDPTLALSLQGPLARQGSKCREFLSKFRGERNYVNGLLTDRHCCLSLGCALRDPLCGPLYFYGILSSSFSTQFKRSVCSALDT